MVGVAELEYDSAAGPPTYDATWADSGDALVMQHVRRDGARLVVQRSGARDTTLAVPSRTWGVAGQGTTAHLFRDPRPLRDGITALDRKTVLL